MAQGSPETIVYVANAGAPEIHVLAMNRASGDLDLIERVPVPGTDQPSPSSTPMAVSPDNRFLHVALRSEPFTAASFAIDPANGRLTHLGNAQYRLGQSLSKTGNKEGASISWERAVDFYEGSVAERKDKVAVHNLGVAKAELEKVLMDLGAYEQAVEAYQRLNDVYGGLPVWLPTNTILPEWPGPVLV